MDDLIGLLYKVFRMLQGLVRKAPFPQAAHIRSYGEKYLRALRGKEGALAALKYLTGKDLPPGDALLNAAQMDDLIGLLYKVDGTLQDFVTKGTFEQAAQNLLYGE